jgi:hypothetical protein
LSRPPPGSKRRQSRASDRHRPMDASALNNPRLKAMIEVPTPLRSTYWMVSCYSSQYPIPIGGASVNPHPPHVVFPPSRILCLI